MVFFGSLVAILLPALSLAAVFAGNALNPLMMLGGAIVGLMLMGVGYLKRIAHAAPAA